MVNLYNYIFERNATKDTLIQELLSCVFFDAWFNLGNEFESTDALVEYYNDNATLISQVANRSKLLKSDFDAFLITPTKKGYIKKCSDWQKSFIYQCESFEKWINAHPSFKSDLVFVHHDSSIGISNGKLSADWNIVKRVENGKTKFGFSDKDNYQKADIYAVTTNLSVKPENDITDEVTYWINGIDLSKETFVGISLKMLGRTLSRVHTYGVDQITMNVVKDSVSVDFPVFDNVKFDLVKGILEAGTNTTNINFTISEDGNEHDATLSIRANGKGEEHAASDPDASFAAPCTCELKIVGAKALAGKTMSLISGWIPNKMNVKGKMESSAYVVLFDNIKSAFGIKKTFSSDAIKLLDFLCTNNDTILNIYELFEKDKKITDEIAGLLKSINLPTNKNIILTLYRCTKWQTILWKILNIYNGIASQVGPKKPIESVILDIVMYAKGISTDNTNMHLPYVLIGE